MVKTEELDKTDDALIFIEKDAPISKEEIDRKMEALAAACDSDDNEKVRQALRFAVPTFKTPEEVNCTVEKNENAEFATV